jgi:DNA gyrase subunit A
MSDTLTPAPARPGGHIEPRLIEREMSESYLTYALSVIHSRALPDVRDGLKPSQRRILVAMNDLRLRPNAKYRKCANIAGTTSGEYHPHGESVIYPTLVRMAQRFSLRYPLIDGQGNFGSIDGDPPAAMRYTEARMAGPSVEMMADLDKETVDYQPNYDERLLEPTVLPGRFPNLLCNGSEGIAVGMATSLPPHNLREIAAAIRAVLDDGAVPLRRLLELVPGPDFPTGGIIMGKSGIYQAYTTGRGRAIVRARHHLEDTKSGKQNLVFTEIPYQVRKVAIIEKIVEVVKDGRITGIADVQDHSDRDGLRLIVELKKHEDPEVILKQLFQFTPLQTTYSVINLALVDGQPKTLTLRGLIDEYIRHRKQVIRRRTRFLLRKAEERRHIVEGLRIAVDHIDEVIRIIRASADTEAAKVGLMSAFNLSQAQAQAIVDMRLGRLTGLEREKLEEEYERLQAEIRDLLDILEREARVVQILREDIDDVEQRYGDARRTEISAVEVDGSFDIEELITEEMMVVTVTRGGYVKRTGLDTYQAQGRGGRGVKGNEAKEGDAVSRLFVAGTHDYVLFFSNLGKVYWQKVYQLPEGARTAKGRAMRNLIELADGELIQGVLRVRSFDEQGYVVFATRRGTIKKTALEAYSRPKKVGIRAIALDEGDEVVSVRLTRPGDRLLLASAGGRAAHFDELAVRPMGRVSRGVRGMRLKGEDQVVGLIGVDAAADLSATTLVTVSRRGFGKRTPIAEYPIKGRGNQGVINIKVTERNGPVVGVILCRDGDELMFISRGGMIVRSRVADLRPMGRNTQGVRLVNLKDDDEVAGVEVITAADMELEHRNHSEVAAEVQATPRSAAEVGAAEEDLADDELLDDEPEAEGDDDLEDADDDTLEDDSR